MAWDTAETKRRLRDAAEQEFAEHGYEGASTARIATRAGVNKERLYNYFGDKRRLWETVLTEEMDQIVAAVEPNVDLTDIGGYAAALFDYHRTHPTLVRLLQWEGLAGAPAASWQARTSAYRRKVEQFEQAQRNGIITSDLEAGHLLFALIALSAWWQTVPQLAELVTGRPADPDEIDRRRAFVAACAERLARPAPPGRSPR